MWAAAGCRGGGWGTPDPRRPSSPCRRSGPDARVSPPASTSRACARGHRGLKRGDMAAGNLLPTGSACRALAGVPWHAAWHAMAVRVPPPPLTPYASPDAYHKEEHCQPVADHADSGQAITARGRAQLVGAANLVRVLRHSRNDVRVPSLPDRERLDVQFAQPRLVGLGALEPVLTEALAGRAHGPAAQEVTHRRVVPASMVMEGERDV
jgi:hypothetical protein